MTQPNPEPGHPEPGMHLWGWTSPEELKWLRETASTMDSVVEVGSLHGRSAFALLTGCPGPVYCIDPWNDEYDKSLPSFKAACGHFPNVHMVQGYSPAVAAEVPDVDMVWIDGCHDYECVVADIVAWTPKTRKLICGHDWNHGGYPGVREGVTALFGARAVGIELPPWTAEDSSIWAVWL